jgi:hypothetical protein
VVEQQTLTELLLTP